MCLCGVVYEDRGSLGKDGGESGQREEVDTEHIGTKNMQPQDSEKQAGEGDAFNLHSKAKTLRQSMERRFEAVRSRHRSRGISNVFDHRRHEVARRSVLERWSGQRKRKIFRQLYGKLPSFTLDPKDTLGNG